MSLSYLLPPGERRWVVEVQNTSIAGGEWVPADGPVQVSAEAARLRAFKIRATAGPGVVAVRIVQLGLDGGWSRNAQGFWTVKALPLGPEDDSQEVPCCCRCGAVWTTGEEDRDECLTCRTGSDFDSPPHPVELAQ